MQQKRLWHRRDEFVIDQLQVKADSERIITSLGGRICDWLPCPDITEMRDREAIVGRALVMLGLMHIHFKAPIKAIDQWIRRVNVADHLSESERALLGRSNEDLTQQELINLYWYIEGIWTLMWVGNLIEELPIDRPVEDRMASLTPNVHKGEDGSKFSSGMRIRSFDDCFRMLDLYYRAHWYTRDGQLNLYDTSPINIDFIMERRKALEWVMDRNVDWDNVPADT
jgi:hypothetical protein